MAGISRDKKEKRIASLMEMGVSRAAAKAALRAKGWETEEVSTNGILSCRTPCYSLHS